MNRLLMKRNGLQGFGEHTSKKIPDGDQQLMSEQLERENCTKGNCRTTVESYLKRVLNPQLSRNQIIFPSVHFSVICYRLSGTPIISNSFPSKWWNSTSMCLTQYECLIKQPLTFDVVGILKICFLEQPFDQNTDVRHQKYMTRTRN